MEFVKLEGPREYLVLQFVTGERIQIIIRQLGSCGRNARLVLISSNDCPKHSRTQSHPRTVFPGDCITDLLPPILPVVSNTFSYMLLWSSELSDHSCSKVLSMESHLVCPVAKTLGKHNSHTNQNIPRTWNSLPKSPTFFTSQVCSPLPPRVSILLCTFRLS